MTESLKETVEMLGLRGSFHSQLELVPVVRKGLPSASLVHLAEHMGLTEIATVESLGLAKRTIARRLKEKQALTPEESERLLRLARVLAEARRVLGSLEKARGWLQKQSRALGDSPLRMLDTDIGAGAVLQELGRIDHGVFA